MYSGIVNGAATTFGTSGLLYRSNKVMYDRATRTLWHQFTGAPIIGPLAGAGIRQPRFPSVVSTWAEWQAEHPDTTVISRDTGLYPPDFYVPENHPNAIYYRYFTDDETMFPVWLRNPELAPKSVVIGVAIGNTAKAHPIDALRQSRVINDTIGGVNIVITASPKTRSARVYQSNELTFTASNDGPDAAAPAMLIDQTGAGWQVTEESLTSADSSANALPRLTSQTSFWFGWYQYHPDTTIYQAGD